MSGFGLQGYIGAGVIAYTILGAPYYNYNIMGPKALFQSLRLLEFGASGLQRGCRFV